MSSSQRILKSMIVAHVCIRTISQYLFFRYYRNLLWSAESSFPILAEVHNFLALERPDILKNQHDVTINSPCLDVTSNNKLTQHQTYQKIYHFHQSTFSLHLETKIAHIDNGQQKPIRTRQANSKQTKP